MTVTTAVITMSVVFIRGLYFLLLMIFYSIAVNVYWFLALFTVFFVFYIEETVGAWG